MNPWQLYKVKAGQIVFKSHENVIFLVLKQLGVSYKLARFQQNTSLYATSNFKEENYSFVRVYHARVLMKARFRQKSNTFFLDCFPWIKYIEGRININILSQNWIESRGLKIIFWHTRMSEWYLLAILSSLYDWKAFGMLINHHNYMEKLGKKWLIIWL